MQQKTASYKIPVGNKSLANIMEMTESEARFFPKLEELKGHITNYNFGLYTKNVLINNLTILKECCKHEKLDAYVEGIENVIKKVKFKY